MSRIAGILAEPSSERPSALDGMQERQAGPEWRRHRVEHPAGVLGWCGWHEPNVATLGRRSLVLDGVLYNREELCPGVSDAAALLATIDERGLDPALSAVNGDFALAMLDDETGALTLARDRFGLRPLYYVRSVLGPAFASRPGPLVALPGVSRQFHPTYVALFAGCHYRYFDNDPTASPFAAIRQLPAATVLQFTAGGQNSHTYWQWTEAPDVTGGEEELAERYRTLLLDAVRRRLARAVRPAFTLSGGMDSSSVLACAVHASGSKQHAVSSVYEDKTYDESDEIATMLEANVAHWHRIALGTPDVFALVPKMVALHDEPVATATWLSHYLVCEAMQHAGFGALFGGLGGDELNAGEYEYFFFHFADLRAAGREAELEHEVAKWVEYHNHPIFRKNRQVMEDGLARMTDRNAPGRCLPDRRRMLRYATALNRDFFDLESFTPVMEHPFTSYLKNRTYQDTTRETIPCCVRAEDRQATAFGLDNFLPFFDHRLVEFMYRVPGLHKIRDGVTKRLLRTAMTGILPEATRTRIKKTGWNAPAHVWFSGGCREQLLDLLASQRFRQRGIYDMTVVDRLAAEHFRIVSTGATEDNHMMFFWQLVNLDAWLTMYCE
jgi:asparagine synthase (glutamine-hydrolysing)